MRLTGVGSLEKALILKSASCLSNIPMIPLQLPFYNQFHQHYMIEGSNIEYGKIENCKIDTILTSKIWGLVTSKR